MDDLRGVLRELAEVVDPVLIAQRLDLTPDPWAAEMLRSRSRRRLAVVHRQGSKSTTAAVLAVHQMVSRPRSTVVVGGPRQATGAELIRKVRTMLADLRVAEGPTPADAVHDGTLGVELSTGSRCVAVPATESARGPAADLLIVDEAAQVPDALYSEVYSPMVAATGGPVVALTSAWLPRGWAYRAAQDPSRQGWEVWTVPATVCARIDPVWLEEERAGMTAAAFAREYLCQWIGSADGTWMDASTLEAISDVDCPHPVPLARLASTPPTGVHVVGIDLGQRSDPSALVALDRAGRVLVADRVPTQRTWSDITQRLADAAAALQPARVLVDATGHTAAVEQLGRLLPDGIPLVEVTLRADGSATSAEARRKAERVLRRGGRTSVSKVDVLDALALAAEQGRLRVHPDGGAELVAELGGLQVGVTATGARQVANDAGPAPTTARHDDLAIAAALACWGSDGGGVVAERSPARVARPQGHRSYSRASALTGLQGPQGRVQVPGVTPAAPRLAGGRLRGRGRRRPGDPWAAIHPPPSA